MSRSIHMGLMSLACFTAVGCSPRTERDCVKEAAETAKTEIAFLALRSACEQEFAPPQIPEDPATNEALATEAAANETSQIVYPGKDEGEQRHRKRGALSAPEDAATNEALATEAAANETRTIIYPDKGKGANSRGKRGGLFTDEPFSPYTK